jgi:hypothetical protein
VNSGAVNDARRARVRVAILLCTGIGLMLTPARPLGAQAMPASFTRSAATTRLPQGAPREVERIHYMVDGGLVGLLIGGFYAGARLGSGAPNARSQVWVIPLAGLVIGAGTGALVYEIQHAGRR